MTVTIDLSNLDREVEGQSRAGGGVIGGKGELESLEGCPLVVKVGHRPQEVSGGGVRWRQELD